MRIDKTISLFTILTLGCLSCMQAVSQTPAPPVKEKRKITVTPRVTPIIVENVNVSPQVVTILHRLNGLKVFRLLLRSTEQVGAIARLDDAFQITNDVHTSVIAGLALDDGQTIAAWLPEAEAEMPPPAITFAPQAPAPPAAPRSSTTAAPATPSVPVPAIGPITIPGLPSIAFPEGLLEPADLKIITRDGKRLLGHYVGLDGLTGLSVITLANSGAFPGLAPKEGTINVGERLRVLGPRPASRSEAGVKGAMYVRIGETDATVVNVHRSPSGGLTRLSIKSGRLSKANIGGIAINDAGETLGIVDAVDGNEATIVPMASVKSAAKRVIARQASVPRPWLGIKGEPVGALSIERIIQVGWKLERARELAEKRQGILLTNVLPGSPAAKNKLKPGDVILSVNNEGIRNSEDFSWLLAEAGPGNSVHFTIARLGKTAAEAFEIELGESPDPFFGYKMFHGHTPKGVEPGSLMSHGIETIAIKPRVALRLGAGGGLLVVYVQPNTAAFKAGLRPGDLIEAIDGQPVSSRSEANRLLKNPTANCSFSVVRNKEKMVVTMTTKN